MIAGLDRTDTQYVWPESLRRPPDGVRLAYLDLNHWIYLAKAASGRPDGDDYREPLEVLRRARDSGRLVLPLSAAHIMEMAGITSPRQRFVVAAVTEELSGFATLVDRLVVMRLEVEAAVDAVSTRRPQPYANVPVLGHGCLQAVGRRGGLRIRHRAEDGGEDIDVTEEQRMKWPGGPDAFDQWQADGELVLDRALLRGPSGAEVPALEARGWDPTVAGRGADRRAKQEEDQAGRLAADPQWRSRLRDIVACRYVALEVREMLQDALNRRGLELEDVWSDIDSARRFADCMPSADIWVSLLTARHRNPQTKWVRNHIFDADALSVAVPYCDIVVPDKESRHLLQSSGVPERFHVSMPVNLAELGELIS